jgi:hypothetical protein
MLLHEYSNEIKHGLNSFGGLITDWQREIHNAFLDMAEHFTGVDCIIPNHNFTGTTDTLLYYLIALVMALPNTAICFNSNNVYAKRNFIDLLSCNGLLFKEMKASVVVYYAPGDVRRVFFTDSPPDSIHILILDDVEQEEQEEKKISTFGIFKHNKQNKNKIKNYKNRKIEIIYV